MQRSREQLGPASQACEIAALIDGGCLRSVNGKNGKDAGYQVGKQRTAGMGQKSNAASWPEKEIMGIRWRRHGDRRRRFLKP
jgi:hypothetical protein